MNVRGGCVCVCVCSPYQTLVQVALLFAQLALNPRLLTPHALRVHGVLARVLVKRQLRGGQEPPAVMLRATLRRRVRRGLRHRVATARQGLSLSPLVQSHSSIDSLVQSHYFIHSLVQSHSFIRPTYLRGALLTEVYTARVVCTCGLYRHRIGWW